MIIAPPGYWLLQIDFSVLELRTLAQICLWRYGRSVLADLFRQGTDPHRYTGGPNGPNFGPHSTDATAADLRDRTTGVLPRRWEATWE